MRDRLCHFVAGTGFTAAGLSTTAFSGLMSIASYMLIDQIRHDETHSGFIVLLKGIAVTLQLATAGASLYGSYRFFRSAGNEFKQSCQAAAPEQEDLHTRLAVRV